jgi:predicted acylesterase/phospholipase RssA
MGSMMAASCALEHDHERMLQTNVDGWAAMVKDKTLPIISFFSGYAISRVLYGELGDTQIEDLWLPFFCVSANLTRARIDVHQRGQLVKALLASARVPGLYPPIVANGDLLVDGGIINNVPVDIMRAYPACGTVIASDVSPAYDPTEVSDYGTGLSGWRALLERLKPASKRRHLPSFFSVLMRTMEFGGASYKSQNIGTADLYLTPPLGEFGLGEYKRASEMAEVGYRYSVEKVAEWLASSPLPQNAVANSITVAVREPGPASAVQLARAESQEASA